MWPFTPGSRFRHDIARNIRHKLLQLLQILPSLRRLDIRQRDGFSHSGCCALAFSLLGARYGGEASPSEISDSISCLSEIKSLQELVFEDVRTTWTDLHLFFGISSLRKLTLINFRHPASSSPNPRLDVSELSARNLQDISFIETKDPGMNPMGPVTQDHGELFEALGNVSTLRWQIYPRYHGTNRLEMNNALYQLKKYTHRAASHEALGCAKI